MNTQPKCIASDMIIIIIYSCMYVYNLANKCNDTDDTDLSNYLSIYHSYQIYIIIHMSLVHGFSSYMVIFFLIDQWIMIEMFQSFYNKDNNNNNIIYCRQFCFKY